MKFMERLPFVDSFKIPKGDKKWTPIKDSGDKKLNGFRSMKMTDYFEYVNPKYVTISITPNREIENGHTEDLAITLSNLHRFIYEKFSSEGKKVIFRVQERVAFEIDITKEEITFNISIPETLQDTMLKRLRGIKGWDRATIKVNPDYSFNKDFNPLKSVCYEVYYRNHDIYSLNVDSRYSAPLDSMLQSVELMESGDRAKVFAYFDPYARNFWKYDADRAWERLRKGQPVMKKVFSKRNMIFRGAWFFTELVGEIVLAFSDFISTDSSKKNIYTRNDNDPLAGQYHIENLKEPTKRKIGANVLRTYLWVLAQSEEPSRARNVAKVICNSYSDLTLDNELVYREIFSKKKKADMVVTVQTKRYPRERFTSNYFSTAEVGQLLKVPTSGLQKTYPQIDSIRHTEVKLPKGIFDPRGIPLGTITDRGQKLLAHFPTLVWDILCRIHIGYGKPGSGKTTALGGNIGQWFITNGFSEFFIDMADGQGIIDRINALPEDYPDDKIMVLSLGDLKYAISLTLARESQVANGKTVSEDEEFDEMTAAEDIVEFLRLFLNRIGNSQDITDNMNMYLQAAGKAELTRNGLMGMFLAITSPAYRAQLVNDPWVQSQPEIVRNLLKLQSGNLDSQVVKPLESRINKMINSKKLSLLFLQKDKVDENGDPLIYFRKWMDNLATGDSSRDKYGYFVGIHIPKGVFQEEGTNLIGSFLLAKLWFATLSRMDTLPEKRKPFLITCDEPHNLINGTGPILKQIAVEARKYRSKLLFLAHDPEQFGNNLDILYSGAPTFTFYATENIKSFRNHANQLKPFTPDEAYEQVSERFTAINKLDIGSDNLPAFRAEMAPPPPFVKDRTYRIRECSEYFGRPWKEVYNQIHETRTYWLEKDEDLAMSAESSKKKK